MIRYLYAGLDAMAPSVLPLLARIVFAGVLLRYYLNSALTKFEGLALEGFDLTQIGVSANAYYQIFPAATEAVGFDTSQMALWQHAIVWAGSVGELVLPVLVVIGLLTRPAALGMIVFIVIQSVVDVTGHGVDAATLGAWFDNASGALIVDQRAFWVLGLAILVFRGGGALSLDRLFHRSAA